jgi:hypothetical protein
MMEIIYHTARLHNDVRDDAASFEANDWSVQWYLATDHKIPSNFHNEIILPHTTVCNYVIHRMYTHTHRSLPIDVSIKPESGAAEKADKAGLAAVLVAGDCV